MTETTPRKPGHDIVVFKASAQESLMPGQETGSGRSENCCAETKRSWRRRAKLIKECVWRCMVKECDGTVPQRMADVKSDKEQRSQRAGVPKKVLT